MFLSLEGLLIGLAVVCVAFIGGVVASVLRPARKRSAPELRQRLTATTFIAR